MNKMNHVLSLAALTALLALSNGTAAAQERPGRGNFDPEQFRQQAMERMKERFEVKDDAEWKIIQPRIEKVNEARREVTALGGNPFGGAFGRRGDRGGDRGGTANQAQQNTGRERRAAFAGFGGQPAPESEDLQKAIEAKASNDDVKAKLAKLREARKQKETALEKAQEDLRKVLSVRQEATAVLMGLLK